MAKTLIIVDSPAKGKIFEEFFQGNAETVVMTAPPVQPIHAVVGGALTYKFNPLATGKELIEKINGFEGREIYLALDGDARSQYLGWLLSRYLGELSRGAKSCKWLDPAGLRPAEIDEALQFVVSTEEQQGFGFYTRALFDAVLGRHLNRLLGTNRGPGNLPLQHNSLTTLFLLEDREQEIKMFSPTKKWQVVAELSLAGHRFAARLEEAYDLTVDGFVKDAEEARRVVGQIHDDVFVVDGIERSNLDIPPPRPYQLLKLLHDAVVLCEIGPRELLGIVRKLHHGVVIKGKTIGLISAVYSSRKPDADEWLLKLREQVTALYGEQGLGSAEIDLEAGMIFPLYPELAGSDVAEGLTQNELKIYELIRSRAVASQMRAATGENIRLEIAAGPETFFVANLHSISEPGFLQIYQGRYTEALGAPCPLAGIETGQELHCVELLPQETAGMPAERYTFETLFVDLADFSITADPVNIFMIQGLINAAYLSISKDGYLIPGKSLSQVNGVVNRAFPRMQGINLVAYIEQTITEAVSGRKELNLAVKQFEQTLMIQGKSLVKAKLPTLLKPRLRASRSIIKPPDEVAIPAATDSVEAAALPPAEQALAAAEPPVSRQAEPPPTQSGPLSEKRLEEQKGLAEGGGGEFPAISAPKVELAADAGLVLSEKVSVLGGGEAELEGSAGAEADAPGEQGAPVVAEEPPLAEAMGEAAFLAEDNAKDNEEWPDELKKIFAEALEESPPAATTPESMTPQEETLATDELHPCQVCGQPMLLKKDRFGKYWSCSGFPACRHSEAYQGGESGAMACPLCREGKIVNKRTPSGKTFYVCLEADCEFMAWSQPFITPCQVCDSPYLVAKKSLSGKMQLKCPRAGCDYSQLFPGGGEVDGLDDRPASPTRKKVRRVRRMATGATPGSGAATGGKRKVRVVRRKKQ